MEETLLADTLGEMGFTWGRGGLFRIFFIRGNVEFRRLFFRRNVVEMKHYQIILLHLFDEIKLFSSINGYQMSVPLVISHPIMKKIGPSVKRQSYSVLHRSCWRVRICHKYYFFLLLVGFRVMIQIIYPFH